MPPRRLFRPVHGAALVLAVVAMVWMAEYALADRGRPHHERVSPDAAGTLRLPVSDLGRNDVRFYRFLNAGNQELLFFVGRDAHRREDGQVILAKADILTGWRYFQ